MKLRPIPFIALPLCAAFALAGFHQPQQGRGSTAPTLGTAQLPGDNGKLATTYQLGPKASALHFNLESAQFTTNYPAPDDVYVAGPKQRLLVLNFSAQNPLAMEQRLGASSFAFTVVSPEDENFEFRGWLLHATKKTHLDQILKPAQKVKCTVVIPIYAEGPVTKLMVQRGTGPVLRYDLTGKVGKLKSVFSPDGIDLVDKGPSLSPGSSADMGPFNVTFDGVSTTSEQILGQGPNAGEHYLCVDVKFTNVMLRPSSIGFQYFTPLLLDTNGEKISWNSELVSRSNIARISQEIAPGESLGARYYFRIPPGRTPKVVKFTHQGSQRTVEFALP